MSTSRNDLQNNSGIFGTPPDMKTFVERTARFIAKNWLEHEKGVMNITPMDTRVNFNFLRSSEDPLHGYYKQKLAEYLSEPDKNTETILPPTGEIRAVIVETARQLSKMGLGASKVMMACNAKEPGYGFLRSSHNYHSFFQQTLTEYRSRNQQDGANEDDVAVTDEVNALPPLPKPQFIHLPDVLQVRLPKGMRLKEFITLKLAAQFAAWYGNRFWLALKKTSGFEFTNPTDTRFTRFTRFVLEYSKIHSPPKDLEAKLRKSDAYTKAIHDGFLRLLQWDGDGLQEMRWRMGGVTSMVNWHASLEKDFANKEDYEELPPLEDQFLAQHPGSCTIRVFVANVVEIEITLQSLSENVASLKEKIAKEIQIETDRLKLSGKAGVLEDNMSFAHYNVGAGEHLTLSL